MTNRTFTLLLLAPLAATLAIAGCRKTAVPPAAPVVDPATAGAITGSVSFNGKAPERVAIDMSMDPACTLSDDKNMSEQIVAVGHKLANVYIYVKSGIADSTAPADAPPVVLDQKGCRYSPHVLALQQGGTVEFRNSDPTMHNIHTVPAAAGNAAVDVSEGPMGQPQRERFKTPEAMVPVRCNNHPWMNAFLNIAPNPYFAVSAADGSFTLRNLPPGTYTLAAVHETLGEQDIQITVTPKSTAQASFSFEGSPEVTG